MAEFKTQTGQLRTKAEQLQGLAERFKTATEGLVNTEGTLMGQWEGPAKEAFHTAFTKDMVQFVNFHNVVMKYVEALITIAGEYEKAEGMNIETAKTRNYQ